MLLLDLLLALVILLGSFLWPTRRLFVEGGDRLEWLNVTPGLPDTEPELSLMRYSPWPLPRQQNFSAILLVAPKPGKSLVLRGRPNDVRYWSFVFYAEEDFERHGGAVPVIDSDRVQLESDGGYEIVLGGEPAGQNWLDTGSAKRGVLFMRNYVPRRGSVIQLPAVYRNERLIVPVREYADDR